MNADSWFALDDHVIRRCYAVSERGHTNVSVALEEHGRWVNPDVREICRGDLDALPIFERRAVQRYKRLFDVDVHLIADDTSCVMCVSWN